MSLFVSGISHRTAGLSVLEDLRCRLGPGGPGKLLPFEGRATVATCNRFDIVFDPGSNNINAVSAIAILRSFFGNNGAPPDVVYCYEGTEALSYLCKVACGLDSAITGEYEIVGQLKRAFAEASALHMVTRPMESAIRFAFSCARKVRRCTSVSKGPVSHASVAYEMIDREFGWSGKKVIVVGAGRLAKTIASRIVKKSDSTVFIANRTFDTSATLALELGVGAFRFDRLPEYIADADIVISSTAAPHYVLRSDNVGDIIARRIKPIVLIDLSVPCNIEPALATPEARIIGITEVEKYAARSLFERSMEIKNALTIIEGEVHKYVDSDRNEKKSARFKTS